MKRWIALLLAMPLCTTLLIPAFAAGSGRITLSAADMRAHFSGDNQIYAAYCASENAMQFATTGGSDPYITLNVAAMQTVSSSAYPYVVITYRAPAANSGSGANTQIFWNVNNLGYAETYSTCFAAEQGYKYRSVVLDMTSKSYWSGNLGSMRIDPFLNGSNAWDTLFIYSIAFCASSSDAAAAATEQADAANAGTLHIAEDTFARKGYDPDIYIEPLTEGTVVFNESVFPLQNSSGTMDPIPLMYNIDRVVSLRNSLLNVEYQYGRDYSVENGRLVIHPTGTITTIPYAQLYQPSAVNENWWKCSDGSYTYIQEGSYYHTLQLAVTYTHSDAWTGTKPASKTNTLSRTAQKLRNGEALNVVLNGDSLTVGANSSGFVGAAPNCPNWADMTIAALRARYASNITYVNTAVGGTTSEWGAANVAANVTSKNPDLAIIGFGLNDLTCGRSSGDFGYLIRTMIDAIRAKNPLCEIILLSAITPNPDIFGQLADTQTAYLQVLQGLAAEYGGIAVADITTMHRELLTRKRYVDMTGNNVNHVNDFLTRVYAQTVTALLCGAEDGAGNPIGGAANLAVWGDYILNPDGSAHTAVSKTITGITEFGNPSESAFTLFGWVAASRKINRFGYRYGNTVVLDSAKFATEDGVVQAGAPIAGSTGESSRFHITIPIYGGDQTAYAVAELDDGAIVDLWGVHYANAPAAMLNQSFNIVQLDNTVVCNTTDAAEYLAANPILFHPGDYSTLSMEGWIYLDKPTVAFGYRIDYGETVWGSFIKDRPDVKSAISEAAEGYYVDVHIASLNAGAHVVEVLAKAKDSTELIAATVPFTILGDPGITENNGMASVVTDSNFIYTATGYNSITADNQFNIISGFSMQVNVLSLPASFNRLSFRYSSTKALKMTVVYIQGGSAMTDVFYLEAGANNTFSALILGYLSGASASAVRTITMDSCDGTAAQVFLYDITAQSVTAHTEEIYYFENTRFKVGLKLSWGGGISYIQDKTHVESGLENLINNFDTGRLVQQSYYGTGPQGSYQPGYYNNADWVYNPVQGGDMHNNASRLIDFVETGDSVYIKIQPQDWSLNAQITPSYMENLYTLKSTYIQVDNRFIDFSGMTHPVTSQEVPAFYTVSYLNRFSCYMGSRPWTNDALTVRDDLKFWGDIANQPDCRFDVASGNTETWCAWTSTQSNFGIGLYVPIAQQLFAGRFGYDGSKSPGASSTNYVAPLIFTALKSYQELTYSYQITTGSVEQIRNTFARIHAENVANLTVHFDANGGVCDVDSAQFTDGSTYANLPTPARTGYKFLGWYTKASGGTQVTASTTVSTSDAATLYAHWQPNTYTVQFNGNGSTSGSMSSLSLTYDVANKLTANAFKRTYTVAYTYNGATGGNSAASATASSIFNGWAASINGEKIYDDTQSVTNLAQSGTVQLYANWTLGTLTLPTPTRTNFVFAGWYTDSALTQFAGAAGETYTPNANVTLYAKWEPAFVPGDCNSDGIVNLQDATILTRCLAGGWGVTVDPLASDVNADGVLNLKDVVLIRRYLAGGWDVELRCLDA